MTASCCAVSGNVSTSFIVICDEIVGALQLCVAITTIQTGSGSICETCWSCGGVMTVQRRSNVWQCRGVLSRWLFVVK